MKEIIKKIRDCGRVAAVYYKTTEAFCAGFLREADEEFLCMQLISPTGRFDGFCCIREEEILKIDVGSKYLSNLFKLYTNNVNAGSEQIPALKITRKGVLKSFIDEIMKKNLFCSMEIGFDKLEKISGFVTDGDWDTVQMRLIDENGEEDGFTAFDVDEIVSVNILSEYESVIEALHKINCVETNKNIPDDKGNKRGGVSEEGVLSFPFGK